MAFPIFPMQFITPLFRISSLTNDFPVDEQEKLLLDTVDFRAMLEVSTFQKKIYQVEGRRISLLS